MAYFKVFPAPVFLACISVASGQDSAQSTASDITRLRETVAAQQGQIDAQRKELDELKEVLRKFVRSDSESQAEVTPLTVFGVASGLPADGSNGRTISWMTNYPSTSRVDYGSEPDLLDKNVSDDRFTTAHTLLLKDVGPSTPIYMRVASTDARAGKVAQLLASTSAD